MIPKEKEAIRAPAARRAAGPDHIRLAGIQNESVT